MKKLHLHLLYRPTTNTQISFKVGHVDSLLLLIVTTEYNNIGYRSLKISQHSLVHGISNYSFNDQLN